MNKESDKISIIVPVYNSEKYLDRCLSSIIGQTYKNLEIICVDDGSTDNSLAICNKYSLIDDRVIVIHKNNGGVTSARKAGVKIASGEWIGFVDSDDWIEPYMYKELLEKMLFYDVWMVCGGYRKCYEDYSVDSNSKFIEGEYNIENDNDFMHNFIFSVNEFYSVFDFSLCDKLFDREKLYSVMNKMSDDIIFWEDAAIVFSYIIKYKKVYIIDKIIYNYQFIDSGSAMHTFDNNKLLSIEKAYDYINISVEKYMNKTKLKEQLKYLKLYFLILYLPEKLESNDGKKMLYIFGDINKTDSLVLYGAGIMGQRYRQYLKKEGVSVCLWVDRRWEKLDENDDIQPPESINSVKYDKILITVIRQDLIDEIKSELKSYGVDDSKIYYLRRDRIQNIL